MIKVIEGIYDDYVVYGVTEVVIKNEPPSYVNCYCLKRIENKNGTDILVYKINECRLLIGN